MYAEIEKGRSFRETIKKLEENDPKITMLRFGIKQKIGSENAKLILRALHKNIFLSRLDLSSSDLGNEGCKILADTVLKSETCPLTTLNISDNNISWQGTQSLSNALKNQTSLSCLDISQNNFIHTSGKHFGEMLKSNTTLTRLDLESNRLGDIGIKQIAQGLKFNKTLQKLLIGRCSISADGLEELANAMGIHPNLKKLSIWGDFLGEKGVPSIIKIIHCSKSLKSLDIRAANITPQSTSSIGEALKTNETLRILQMDGSKQIAHVLKYNTTLTELMIKPDTSESKLLNRNKQFLKTSKNSQKSFVGHYSLGEFKETSDIHILFSEINE